MTDKVQKIKTRDELIEEAKNDLRRHITEALESGLTPEQILEQIKTLQDEGLIQ